MDLTDIFIITKLSRENLQSFLEKQLNDFSSMDEYYEYPKYTAATTFETEDFEEMLKFILNESGRSYTFYFENNSNELYPQGIIQINKDNSMCLGLAAVEENVNECIEFMSNIFPGEKIYISNEIPLPSSMDSI